MVEDNAHKLAIAHAHKEVLVAYRGRIPDTMLELIDDTTGLSLGALPHVVEQVATAGRGPRF